ncbi:MAG TPA: hypothetical protein VNN73_03620 [Blastocatellia bacterium]|nr:hypothetical protein [Blastocatellia bacterium]
MIVTDLICDGVLLPAIGVMGLMLAARAKSAKEEIPAQTNKTDEVSNAPESDEREALRASHQVKLLEEKQQGFGVDNLPGGVYGFSFSPHNEAPLFQNKLFRNFEVHKLADETVHFIGYVSEDDAARLSNQNDYAEVILYPDKWQDALKIVSLPRARLLKTKGPSRDEGNGMKLKLGPLNESVN